MKEIQLSQGKIALVDDEDFDRVNQFNWCAQNTYKDTWYAARYLPRVNGSKVYQYLHSFILPGVGQVDHKDCNGLNNQKHNLRPSNQFQNMANRIKCWKSSSKFKGVAWDIHRKLWKAGIGVNNCFLNLGRYDSEIDAAHVYDYAAKIYFGEFARLNFPE